MRYNQSPNVGEATRFASSPMAEVEFSRMTAIPTWKLPFNAGDIVPIYYAEVLPHETLSIDVASVIRQTTLLRPTMDEMQYDIHAFWVPNRIVNESWKNLQGENTSGFWTAPNVTLAPLYKRGNDPTTSIQVPVNSLADYYGYPSQLPIPVEVLEQCNDMKLRGYLSCYNHNYRDQNYQPPVPFSTLNVYNGFFVRVGERFSLSGNSSSQSTVYKADLISDGSEYEGAITKAVFGEGQSEYPAGASNMIIPGKLSSFCALDKPLKANKLHDYFTSALPSPQKGPEVYFGVGSQAPVIGTDNITALGSPLKVSVSGSLPADARRLLTLYNSGSDSSSESRVYTSGTGTGTDGAMLDITGTNFAVDLSNATGVSLDELRTAIAVKQVYECLSRGGSRYVSVLRNFFELETESPFMDIPLLLGHVRGKLDLYQVAQTSATDSESPQGTLSGYGYTNDPMKHLFTRTFIEHGYVHIFCVVRQKNSYSSYLAPDNFRRSTLDFYLPQFANISEQPIRLAQLNPFTADSLEKAIGYQEAWAEYRYEPDRILGSMRSGVAQSLDVWHYGDDFDPNFTHIDGAWLKSNAEEVLNRTLAVTSDVAPQFKGQFTYRIDKQLPMPTFSVPGLDTI